MTGLEISLIVVVGVLLALLAVVLVAALLRRAPGDSMLLLQDELQEIRRTLDTKLSESTRELHQSVKTQLSESTGIVRDVTERLTRLGETNAQVISAVEGLRKLQDVLQNPKQRGVLGEYFLETVLQNVLPPRTFRMQHSFKNGEKVDAAVFVKDKIIAVDSKFSLENYNRLLTATDPAERERLDRLLKQDLKNRIDETSKYVRPGERTVDFALVFVPSDALYYEILVGSVGSGASARDLIEYAFAKKVIVVSPTTFLAYLQTVLQGLKALQIEEDAQKIRHRVEDLGRHIGRFDEYYRKLGDTLGTTVSHYNAGYKELAKVDKDVLQMTGSSQGIEPMALDKPQSED